MAKKAKSEGDQSGKTFAVGDHLKVKLNDGRMVDAAARAVVQDEDEIKLQVDYGHEETALIGLWQIVR
jgi:hypothetical protein